MSYKGIRSVKNVNRCFIKMLSATTDILAVTPRQTVQAMNGGGLLNSVINTLPVELHFPGYQYCGPGTKLMERINRGDPGKNPLDRACREHDIFYNRHKDFKERQSADRVLADKAWERVHAKDASLGEKIAGLSVANMLKAKTLGMEHEEKRKSKVILKEGHLLVWVSLENVTFPLDLIRPDLQAIENYSAKNPGPEPLDATVRWPQGISFRIRKGNQDHLVIEGPFTVENLAPDTYDGNLYFKNDKFYSFNKESSLEPMSSHISVTYKLGYVPLPRRNPFVSISYFSLEEIQGLIKPFYEENKAHIRSFLTDVPTTFLATSMAPYPFMVEYIKLTTNTDLREQDANVRVLVGESRGSKLTLTESVEGVRLGLKGDTRTLWFYQSSDVDGDFYKPSFAVRMASTGFLAENLDSGVRFYGHKDLTAKSQLPTAHSISGNDFLAKLKKVEPRFTYGIHNVPLKRRPDKGDFQDQGHLLQKKINLKPDGNLDPACPLYVFFPTKGRKGNRICTDDSRLWIKQADGPVLYLADEKLAFHYPDNSLVIKRKTR